MELYRLGSGRGGVPLPVPDMNNINQDTKVHQS
jgi:hypothetical protein